VSQIREQLEAIEDTVEEAKVVMNTLNGLPRSFESFIQGICSRRNLTSFSRLWEDCTEEEARLAAREEKLGDDENQSLAAHARKERERKRFTHTKSLKGHKRQKSFKRITQITNATFSIRWDTLQ
jgi:hypothetical protein